MPHNPALAEMHRLRTVLFERWREDVREIRDTITPQLTMMLARITLVWTLQQRLDHIQERSRP